MKKYLLINFLLIGLLSQQSFAVTTVCVENRNDPNPHLPLNLQKSHGAATFFYPRKASPSWIDDICWVWLSEKEIQRIISLFTEYLKSHRKTKDLDADRLYANPQNQSMLSDYIRNLQIKAIIGDDMAAIMFRLLSAPINSTDATAPASFRSVYEIMQFLGGGIDPSFGITPDIGLEGRIIRRGPYGF